MGANSQIVRYLLLEFECFLDKMTSTNDKTMQLMVEYAKIHENNEKEKIQIQNKISQEYVNYSDDLKSLFCLF